MRLLQSFLWRKYMPFSCLFSFQSATAPMGKVSTKQSSQATQQKSQDKNSETLWD